MAEPTPDIRFDDSASEEQRQAIGSFMLVAAQFDAPALQAALRLVDDYPRVTDTVLPLTRSPETTSSLFDSWRKIKDSKAYTVVEFDQATEEAIASEPAFKALIETRDSAAADKEEVRAAILRLRFAMFIGRQLAGNPKEGTGKIPA